MYAKTNYTMPPLLSTKPGYFVLLVCDGAGWNGVGGTDFKGP